MPSNLFVPKFAAEPGFIVCPTFPEDARNPFAWDAFWNDLLFASSDVRALRLDAPNIQYIRYLDLCPLPEYRNVLFAGNGISVFPELFSHCGYMATAVDISVTANNYCKNHPAEEIYAMSFFAGEQAGYLYSVDIHRFDLNPLREAVRSAFRPGGNFCYIAADIFDYEPDIGSYDLIVTQNLIEHFGPSDRISLAKRFFRLLRPGGILIVESQYLKTLDITRQTTDGIEEYFEQAGFVFHLKQAYLWRQDFEKNRTRKQNATAIRKETEVALSEFDRQAKAIREQDMARVSQGEKLVIFRFGR